MSQLTRTATIHNFVYDPVQVKRFAGLIHSSEKIHQLFLSSRRKYISLEEIKNPSVNHINIQTLRNVSPEEYLLFVRSYELEVGSYTHNNQPLPSESLVIYGTTNARSVKKAIKHLVPELISAGFDNNFDIDLSKRCISAIMKGKEEVEWLTIDIDDKEPSSLPEVKKFLTEEDIDFLTVETRGGYHVLFTGRESVQVLLRYTRQYTIGDIFCPIPGTYQGGFPVKFLSIEM